MSLTELLPSPLTIPSSGALRTLRPDRYFWQRLKLRLTRAFVEAPDEVPGWARAMLPRSRRRYLDGLKRIDATPFARPRVDRVSGRLLSIGGREYADFATGCYLGLDFDVSAEDLEIPRRHGLRNGWSRASGITPITRALEQELEARLGFDAVRLAASISLVNLTIFYSLKNLFPFVLVDEDAHITMKRGIRAAYGSTARSFPTSDLRALARSLASYPADLPKLVVIDGVYSMKGVRAPLEAILALCHRHDATCYIDDAHGLGVLGARGLGVAETLSPEDRQRTILVAAFAKACSNPVAFVGFPERLWYGVDAADFLTFCGPPSNFHSGVALRHLRGFDSEPYRARREAIASASRRLHALCGALGIATFSEPGMPILSVRITDPAMEAVVQVLAAHGVFAKIAIFPVARTGDECIRFCITALHSEAQLCQLEAALVAAAKLCVQELQ